MLFITITSSIKMLTEHKYSTLDVISGGLIVAGCGVYAGICKCRLRGGLVERSQFINI